MKVKFLLNVGTQDMQPRSERYPNSPEFPAKPDGTAYRENETADLRESDAEKFLRAGIAVAVTEVKK